MRLQRKKKAPPREHRQARLLICQMDRPRHDSQRVVMLDISPRGMACRAVDMPEQGDRVSFVLGDLGEAPAKVMWVEERRFGVRFDVEIDCISILLSRTGFRAMDYDLPRDTAFESIMLSELFHAGELN